ncbi:hypothetical protein ACP4OV_002455 [Aristida adscensionis]
MRGAPLALRLRRLLRQCSSGILQHQPRDYCNPHLDYSNHRAFTFPPPCRPRGSHPVPSAPPPPPPLGSLSFSSLAGGGRVREATQAAAGEEGEGEVLDMEAGTVRCAANYAPLSPISFLERAAAVYGARAAVVYGERRRTWRESRDRCARVAAALATRFGVARGDVPCIPWRLG